MYGFMGRTLRIDLTERSHVVTPHDESYYREYLGGSLLAARLFEEELARAGIDGPFSPHNPIIFATGPLAGESICGATRVNVLTVSPETTGTYLSQAGGEFGPALKRAGLDALVITGRSESPVYVKVSTDDEDLACDFVDARHLWGLTGFDVHEHFSQALAEKHQIACIGPAGENRVACANIMFEVDHFAGRGGLGAVMGSKNLKVICVRGDKKPTFKDRKKALEINRAGAARQMAVAPSSFLGVLRNVGTFGLLALNQDSGNLPTHNFTHARVESTEFEETIDHRAVKEQIIGRSRPCMACYVACKKRYHKDSPHVDKHAAAEYESIALLGPNLGLENNLAEGLRACELCNALGLDTMSVGNMIAWLMDCFEHNLLDERQLGFSIRFGDVDQVCQLIENIALRRGVGANLLADGVLKAVRILGEATRPYLRASRGIGLPAHMPRKKPGVGFGYFHGPNPADHMKLEHDWLASDPDMLKDFGLEISSEPEALDENKVEIARATQIYYSLADVLSLCMFVFGPGNLFTFDEITDLVNAATGLNLTFSDLMQLGERSVQLQRELYVATGGEDEKFPEFLETEIPAGPSQGQRITRSDFEKARAHYYDLWNWHRGGTQPARE